MVYIAIYSRLSSLEALICFLFSFSFSLADYLSTIFLHLFPLLFLSRKALVHHVKWWKVSNLPSFVIEQNAFIFSCNLVDINI